MSEDDFIYWQDVLDDVASGKTAQLRCPFCQTIGVTVKETPAGLRIECPSCRHYIEGRFPTASGA